MTYRKTIVQLIFIIFFIAFMFNTVYSDTIISNDQIHEVLSFPMPVKPSVPVKRVTFVKGTTTSGQSSNTMQLISAGKLITGGNSTSVKQPVIVAKLIHSGLPIIVAKSVPTGQSTTVGQSIPVGQSVPLGQSEKPKTSSIPIGETVGRPVTAGIFGERGGRYHPFVLFQEIYTNNLFATHSNTKDDFITTAAPGIWLAFPANRAKLLTIDTTTTAPGGLKLSRIKPETTRRYQTYFLYSPEFVNYSGYSGHDHVNHKSEGLLQYNFNSGLSLGLIDIFNYKEEIAGNGVTNTLYRHLDNLADFMTIYDTPSGKLKLKFDYSNYHLHYRDAIVSYRDRNDNSFGFSVFYKFWPKTSLFGEYDYAKIDFSNGTKDDSVENRYYAGVNWDVTAKTRGRLKLGYITKNFDSAGVEDQQGFSLELQARHSFTPKRTILINAYRKFNESDMSDASSFLSTGIDVALLQRFTEKWSGTLDASYERNEYNGFDRNDNLYSFGPALRFKPRKYLFFDLGSQFYYNNSNISIFDYDLYQVFFRATLSL